MLPAGGQGHGSTWIMLPSSPSEWMPDSHSILASAVRLGRQKTPALATCYLLGRDGEVCGAGLQDRLLHFFKFKMGPARTRPHR
eukprot:3557288-Karenia_brevis.AAC.1